MNWYRHPQTVEALAASYVMGGMSARARRRFEQVMSQRTEVAQAAALWAERALPVALSLPAQTPAAPSWNRLAAAAGLDAPSASPSPPTRWWQRLFAPLPAGALAMGLMIGLALPVVLQVARYDRTAMQLPESYVGVLATADGKPGLIVSSLRRGTVVDLKVVTPVPVPAGHYLHLWRIDKDGVPSALGPLPEMVQGTILRMNLSEPAEKAFFPAVELAVSVESGANPPPQPTQPYVYRGLCGKVWK
jgi:anti-sigma-K factor RskA